MDGKKHAAAAAIVASSVVVAEYITQNVSRGTLYILPIAITTALLPDIDTKSSLLGKYIIFRPLQAICDHRTITHWPVSCVIAVSIIRVLVSMHFPWLMHHATVAATIGFMTHLILDVFGRYGIPLTPCFKKNHKAVYLSLNRFVYGTGNSWALCFMLSAFITLYTVSVYTR